MASGEKRGQAFSNIRDSDPAWGLDLEGATWKDKYRRALGLESLSISHSTSQLSFTRPFFPIFLHSFFDIVVFTV